MVDYTIQAETRTEVGKLARHLRETGSVPAVLYGGSSAPMNLKFDSRELEKIVRHAGTSNLITIQVEDGANETALLREVQYDTIHRMIKHVDFFRVSMDEEITTEIGIELVGKGPTVGMVVQDVNSVEVTCLPGDLVSVFIANIDLLHQIGDTLTIKDLNIPDTITVNVDPEEVVVHVEHLRVEEVETDMVAPGEVRTVSEEKHKAKDHLD